MYPFLLVGFPHVNKGCLEGVFEASVLPFKHANRLWSVQGGVLDFYVEVLQHVLPQVSCEGRTIVRGHQGGQAPDGGPLMKKGIGCLH